MKKFKVTAFSDSGNKVFELIEKGGFRLDFPYIVVESTFPFYGKINNSPIVYEEGKSDEYHNWISLGHYIYETI